jgi:hypothetical protein
VDVQRQHRRPGLRPNIVCRRSSPSRSFVLATLRALHLDRSYVGDKMSMYEGPTMLAVSVVRVIIEQVALHARRRRAMRTVRHGLAQYS